MYVYTYIKVKIYWKYIIAHFFGPLLASCVVVGPNISVSMEMAVLWVVTSYSPEEAYGRSKGTCCHHQGARPNDGGITHL